MVHILPGRPVGKPDQMSPIGAAVLLNVTGPYQVYWKVKNNGSEALDAQQPRGQVEEGSSSRYESTSYVGSHYVEVYIVQNDVCVAMSRQPVIIQPR